MRPPPGYQFQALPPTRICDTRLSTTSCLPLGPIGSNQNHKIPVAGDQDIPAFGGVPTVVAVIANLTAIAPTAKTVLILYPANLPPPNASDLNVEAGEVLPNLVVVQLDTRPPTRTTARSRSTTVPAASTPLSTSRAGSSSQTHSSGTTPAGPPIMRDSPCDRLRPGRGPVRLV